MPTADPDRESSRVAHLEQPPGHHHRAEHQSHEQAGHRFGVIVKQALDEAGQGQDGDPDAGEQGHQECPFDVAERLPEPVTSPLSNRPMALDPSRMEEISRRYTPKTRATVPPETPGTMSAAPMQKPRTMFRGISRTPKS